MAIEIRTNARIMAGFIPHRLEIENRPELSDFPFNILFGNFITINGTDMTATALYTPELDTYTENSDERSLSYRNIYGPEGKVTITKDKHGWKAAKSVKGKYAQFAFGKDWKMFFVNLTTPGLCNGESCKYEKVLDDTGRPEIN